MNKIEKLADKLMKMSISDLLATCALGENSKLDEKRKDFLYMILEERLMARRLLKTLGVKNDQK